MKTIKALAIAGLVLGTTACPYRQKNLRLVFVPTPPLAAASRPAQSGVMVIEKPAPPEPAAPLTTKPSPPQQSTVLPTPHPAPPAVRKPAPPPAPATTTTTAGSPQLEPARSIQQRDAMQRQVDSLQRDLHQRIEQLSRLNLSGASRKTLEDARMFVNQSQEAMKTGNLLQSYKLAQKADLLVGAVEKQR